MRCAVEVSSLSPPLLPPSLKVLNWWGAACVSVRSRRSPLKVKNDWRKKSFWIIALRRKVLICFTSIWIKNKYMKDFEGLRFYRLKLFLVSKTSQNAKYEAQNELKRIGSFWNVCSVHAVFVKFAGMCQQLDSIFYNRHINREVQRVWYHSYCDSVGKIITLFWKFWIFGLVGWILKASFFWLAVATRVAHNCLAVYQRPKVIRGQQGALWEWLVRYYNFHKLLNDKDDF